MKSINLMKNVGRFTPPPNHRVRLTLKLSLAIYPPPEIVESDLPSNRLYDLPSNRLWRFTPPQIHRVRLTLKSSVRFTLKSSLAIYPSPPNCQVQLTLKSSVQFTLKLSLVIYPPPHP